MQSISLENGRNYLKIEDIRRKLGGISRTAFWRLRQLPDFPPGVQLTPGLCVWEEGELDQYLENRKIQSTVDGSR